MNRLTDESLLATLHERIRIIDKTLDRLDRLEEIAKNVNYYKAVNPCADWKPPTTHEQIEKLRNIREGMNDLIERLYRKMENSASFKHPSLHSKREIDTWIAQQEAFLVDLEADKPRRFPTEDFTGFGSFGDFCKGLK